MSSRHENKVEYDAVIEQSPCRDTYLMVESCLAANNRDWTACKQQVERWKQCFANEKSKAPH